MLPVTSEALSVAAHPPAKNGGGKPDSDAKSPFEAMLGAADTASPVPGSMPAPAPAAAANVASKGATDKADPVRHGLVVPQPGTKSLSNNKEMTADTSAQDGANAPGAPGQPSGGGTPTPSSPIDLSATEPEATTPESQPASGMDPDTFMKTGQALPIVDVPQKVWPMPGSGASQPQASGKSAAKANNNKEPGEKAAAKVAEPNGAANATVAATVPAAPAVAAVAPASDIVTAAPERSSAAPSISIRLAQTVAEPAAQGADDRNAAGPDQKPPTASGAVTLPLSETRADGANLSQASASTSSSPPSPSASNAPPAKPDANAPADPTKAVPAQQGGDHAASPPIVAASALDKIAPAQQERLTGGDAAKPTADPTAQALNVIQTAAPPPNSVAIAAARPADGAPSPIAVAVPIEGIAVAIASKAADGKKSFDIRLDPPDLGRIHVHLDVDSSGQITSHVIADRSDTLDLLRRDSTGLERALQDAGLKTSSNGLQFSLRDQSQGQTGQQQQPMPSPHLIVADEPTIDTPAPVYRLLTGARGGLDIRV